MLLSFLKRTRATHGLACLGLDSDGVALAHIVGHEAESLRLAVCAYQSCEDSGHLSRAAASVVRDHGLAGAACVGVLSPEQYSLRLVDAPDVSRAELGAAARWLIGDLVDFNVDEAVIDFFEVPQQTSRGRPKRIYVVAAEARVVQRMVDVVQASGLKLAAIDITELSLRNLSALIPEDEGGLALMHLGGRDGLITMTQGGRLYLARKLETGLDQLAGFETGRLDTGEGLALARDAELFDGLLLEVQRSLDYYESQLGQPPVPTLVVAPLEREVPELVPYLAKNLTVDVRALDLSDLIECSQPLPGDIQARCLSVVGAALRVEPTAP